MKIIQKIQIPRGKLLPWPKQFIWLFNIDIPRLFNKSTTIKDTFSDLKNEDTITHHDTWKSEVTISDELSLVAGKIKCQQITSAHVYTNFKLTVI